MSETSKSRVIRLPTYEEEVEAFEAYALAVGKVVHEWNFLMERSAQLFHIATGLQASVAYRMWYSNDSDRTQLHILQGAIAGTGLEKWHSRSPQAKNDLKWLVDTIIALHDIRNNAVHAPCQLATDADGTVMAASYFTLHRRAKNLRGKPMLVELDWCERWAECLSIFTIQATKAISDPSQPWPERPGKPDRRRQKDLQHPRRQPQH